MTKCFEEFIVWQRREACRQIIIMINSKSCTIVEVSDVLRENRGRERTAEKIGRDDV